MAYRKDTRTLTCQNFSQVAAMVGDKWADDEYMKGFSVDEAVRIAVKFADYNNDGYMSRAESALLTWPPDLFSAVSPEGQHGENLSVDDILNSLQGVSACEEMVVVEQAGDLSLKTLYMPRFVSLCM